MRILKLSLLAIVIGILAGTASAIFLVMLTWATEFRIAHLEIIVALPLAGFAIGWLYYRFGGIASGGNTLVIEQVHSNNAPLPARMTPMILIGTVGTHLFGGSAGREGTAIQMGASLADTLRRGLARLSIPISADDRRLMLLAGISGGFASVFGTPIAGFVFALEVPRIGRIDYESIAPCLIAACVGDLVTRAWGVGHAHYPYLPQTEIDAVLLLKVALVGIACGLVSRLFVWLTDTIRHVLRGRIAYPPLRPLIGGVIVLGLVVLVGTQDYLGLSLPLIQTSVSGWDVPTFAFLLKLIFTAVTLGSGFLGGEVTPLFAIGSTLGFTLGEVVGVDPAFMASLGFVAVFAGASNTPLACAIMGVELFGSGAAIYGVVICMVAYLVSAHRGIYTSQRIEYPKLFEEKKKE